jgi:hypothetical protein
LARPGEVIRKSRGDLATQLKSLPKRPARKTEPPKAKPAKPTPPPKRNKLDAAEAALRFAEQQQAAEVAKLEAQLEELHARHANKLAKLMAKRDAAREDYQAKLEAWGS